MIQFPALNIDTQNAQKLAETGLLFDQFIYTDSPTIFDTYYAQQKYVDSKGDIYQLIAKQPTTVWWRRLLRFLPNTYKVTLLFQATGDRLTLDETKAKVLEVVQQLTQDDQARTQWIADIRTANSIEALLVIQQE